MLDLLRRQPMPPWCGSGGTEAPLRLARACAYVVRGGAIAPHFSATLPARPGFPRTSLFGRGAAQLARQVVKDRGAVALAGSFAAELAVEQRLDADQQDDADHPYQCYASGRV